MKKEKEKGHLCCVIQAKGGMMTKDIMNFYRRNRYYPGLTGAVVLGDDHVLLILEGHSDMVIDKFLDITSTFRAYIEIISTGSLIDDKRTFNSWDFGMNSSTKKDEGLINEINQEEVSSINKIMRGEGPENLLTRSIKAFLLKGETNDCNKFWENS